MRPLLSFHSSHTSSLAYPPNGPLTPAHSSLQHFHTSDMRTSAVLAALCSLAIGFSAAAPVARPGLLDAINEIVANEGKPAPALLQSDITTDHLSRACDSSVEGVKDTLDSTVENVGTLQEGLGLGRRGLLDAVNEIVANEVEGIKDTLDSTVENVGTLQEGLGLRKRYGLLDAVNDIVESEVEGLKDTLDSTVENVSYKGKALVTEYSAKGRASRRSAPSRKVSVSANAACSMPSTRSSPVRWKALRTRSILLSRT